MAYGTTGNDATDLTLAAADKTILLGNNNLRTATNLFWTTGATDNLVLADAGAGNEEDSDAPTTLLYDDATAARSWVTAGTYSTVYLLAEWSTAISFDTVAFLNHNLKTESITVTLEVADNRNMTGSLSTILLSIPSSDRRQVYLTIGTGDGYKYTNVQYLRFKFAGTTIAPKIGEIFVGVRRQMPVNPREGYDTNRLESRTDNFESIDGNVTAYVRHKGRRVVNATFQLHEDTYIDRMETFFEDDTDFGTEPFLWIDQPTTDVQDAPMMRLMPPTLIGPTTGVYERNFQISAKEIGPVYNASEF